MADLFGFRSFRPYQREIVEAILSGRDVFAVMPTGGGKSLCYQLPARVLPGAAVVVSPLIALMKDQVDNARANGLSAASFNSSSSPQEKSETRRLLAQGRLDLLYVSPERLLLPDFLDELGHYELSFFAIDEAHCVSEWGHDFRPDYLGLKLIGRHFPQKPIAAFTATATERVAEDIAARLGLRSPFRIRASFNRSNLHYQAAPKGDLNKQILEIMAQYPGESGLVYRSTRRKTEETAAALAKKGVAARAYHAGLEDAERRSCQEDFQKDRCQVVVATVAFGMGIDKPNVRFVIHGDLPKNLESYYQETGRAGRDGEPAHCALFYGSQEMVLWRRFAEELAEGVQRRAALEQLQQMINYAQRDGCRRKALLAYFNEELGPPPQAGGAVGDDGGPDRQIGAGGGALGLPGLINCGGCDICLGEVERVEATMPAQMALSAMVRTGGRFGSAHLADILVGADTEKIRANGHQHLPTHGVGREYDRRFWRDLMSALLNRGLAENSGDERFPTLAASPRSYPLLRGEEKFFMLRTAAREKVRRRPKIAMDDAGQKMPPVSEELVALLKAERRRLALAADVPPYIIFSDRALREMAQLKPTTANAFLEITGVGRHKLAQYGHQFMKIIDEYL